MCLMTVKVTALCQIIVGFFTENPPPRFPRSSLSSLSSPHLFSLHIFLFLLLLLFLLFFPFVIILLFLLFPLFLMLWLFILLSSFFSPSSLSYCPSSSFLSSFSSSFPPPSRSPPLMPLSPPPQSDQGLVQGLTDQCFPSTNASCVLFFLSLFSLFPLFSRHRSHFMMEYSLQSCIFNFYGLLV